MSSYTTAQPAQAFTTTLAPFLQGEGLPFADVLSAADIEQAFADEGVSFGDTAHAVYTPALILWAFLSQVVHKDKSCQAAVLRVVALLLSLQQQPCSKDTGAYCRARAKLPAAVLKRLALQVGQQLEAQVPQAWLWKGRHAKLIDGSTVTAPDTPQNQQAYPQSTSQQPGLGFPILRLVVLLSLATATTLGMAMGPYAGKETGETALLRTLLGQLVAGDVLVADRYFCSYFLVALAVACGCDVVFRMHQRRDYDFRRGQRLGPDDHVVVWERPQRPEWMDAATYATIPETLTMREVRVRIRTQGCRTEELVLVTTLTDAATYTKDDLENIYHQRWHAELDLRAIKQALQMDQLHCKTPFMIEKELWATLLGYNLVRKVAAQTAIEQGIDPRQISFTTTAQALTATWQQWTLATAAERLRQGKAILSTLSQARVGQRPNRYEPRAVKRRPKEYDRLMKPRAQARAELLQNQKR
jgi:putative transposase